jgi:glycosyltransferase involved in cell wall biosynthesis
MEQMLEQTPSSILVHSPDMLGLSFLRRLEAQYQDIANVIWNSPLWFPLQDFQDLPTVDRLKHASTQPLYWLRKQMWLAHNLEQYRTVFNSETNLASFKEVFGQYPESEYTVINPTSPLCRPINPTISAPEVIAPELQGRFIILTSGRVTRKKGLGRLQNIIYKLDEAFSKQFPKVKLGFVVAGGVNSGYGAEYLDNLPAMGKDLRQSVCVGIANPTDERLSQIYANSDLFVIPSTIEGFGLVTVEAGFHGLPVVGMNSRGSAEVVPKFAEYGHLIEDLGETPGDEEIQQLFNFVADLAALRPEERVGVKQHVTGLAVRNFDPETQNKALKDFILP